MYIKLLLLSIILLAVAIAGIAIKMFIKKGGEFKKQCSSIDPETGTKLGCSCEGSPGDGSCNNEQDKQLDISPTLAQFKELQTE